MKPSVVALVGWLLLISVTAFYLIYVYEAIAYSLFHPNGKGPADYPDILATAMGSIQALLLTNLGILLGISVALPESNIARSLKLNSTRGDAAEALMPPMDMREKIQLYGLVIYVAGLIACTIAWVCTNFKTDSSQVVPFIPESGKLFIGVCIAYLTALFKR